MKTSHFFYMLLPIVFGSCNEGQNNGRNQGIYTQHEKYQENMNKQSSNNRRANSGNIKMYKIMNKQFGMPAGAMPIPSTWKRSNNTKDGVYFEGPDDVKVYNEQSNSFFYSNNAQRNQFAQQNGSQVQPLKSLERLIAEDFKPMVKQQGVQFVRQYPLPQLAQFDKQFDNYLFKATPENKQYQCMVTEWLDSDGKKSMLIFRYFVTQYTSIGGMEWGYTCNAMDASPQAYEAAKNAYIYSLVNFKINPQWVQKNNQYYAQMAQQQNAGHQTRMGQIRAFGEQNTQNFNARSAASDAQYNSWRQGQAASDAGQAAAVDGIWEQQNMTDSNGNQYKVDGYDDNVWMNQNNETIGTDNPNWNPNVDNTTNGDHWEQLESTDDGW